MHSLTTSKSSPRINPQQDEPYSKLIKNTKNFPTLKEKAERFSLQRQNVGLIVEDLSATPQSFPRARANKVLFGQENTD